MGVKILFTGGGSGGHILPIIGLVREIRKAYQKPDLQLFYLGPKEEFGEIFLSQENIKAKYILAGKIRRYLNAKTFFQNLVDCLFKIPIGILQSFFYIFIFGPDVIFSKGGFGSIPVVIAGRILLTPVLLHESDIAPGLANRILSHFALEVFVSFPRTEYFPPGKMTLIGNPIRKEILETSREEAGKFLELIGEKPLLLILGGSQGAQRINDKILEILPELLKDFEIIHQCGYENFREVKAEAKAIITPPELEKNYHLFPFLKEEELKRAYAVSDLILSRAGAGTIFEIAAVGKPSILVPLPESAQNHQVKNAYAYAENGATIVMEEANFTSRFFLEKLRLLINHPEELKKMAKSAQEFARPDAAKIIAAYIVTFLTK